MDYERGEKNDTFYMNEVKNILRNVYKMYNNNIIYT